MGFRENSLKKIEIEELTRSILHAMGSPNSGRRIDLDDMRKLVDMGPYRHHRERDLDIYILDESGPLPHLLVLDNELKIYRTTAEDVALRKSPTVKEMVSIRNAIKILNDKDVVVGRKADTVQRINNELIGALDLTYDQKDVAALVEDGTAALANNYTDGLTEVAMIFAELLGYLKAPGTFQANHHIVWGKVEHRGPGDIRLGPAILLNLLHNELKMMTTPFSSTDKAAMQSYRQILKGETEPDLKGKKVLAALQKAALEAQPS